MGFTDRRTFMQHWPVMVLGLLVAGIFLAALVTFEVKETEFAIVKVFGKPRMDATSGVDTVKVYRPGLHLQLPYPISKVWRHDRRRQCYQLTKGQVEQVQTADDYQIIVTTFVIWEVGNPGLFMTRLNTTTAAEAQLDDLVRNSRNTVLGKHSLSELINVDPQKVRLAEIEQEILDDVQDLALRDYGISLVHLGFKHLGFPEQVSREVFERMKAERNRKSNQYLAEGKEAADAIVAESQREAKGIIAAAEAEAKRIRGEGDQIAATYYAAFAAEPELAAFLRKLDALRLTLANKTTLILDTSTPPYDLFLPGATDLKLKSTTDSEAAGK